MTKHTYPITIAVRGKPVPKGRPRIGKDGAGHARAFTPADTRKYEAEIRLYASQAMRGRQPLTGPVEITICVRLMPPKKHQTGPGWDRVDNNEVQPTTRPDIDNYIKVALDGINEIVFGDDSQVVKVTAWKEYVRSFDRRVGLTIHVYSGLPIPEEDE